MEQQPTEQYFRCKEPWPRCVTQCDECAGKSTTPYTEQQPKGIPEEMEQAIQTAGDFYGYQIPDEDLKRRRPVEDFKAGAEWQYRYLSPQMEAMRKALEEIAHYRTNTYAWAARDSMREKAKNVLDQYPSPKDNDNANEKTT